MGADVGFLGLQAFKEGGRNQEKQISTFPGNRPPPPAEPAASPEEWGKRSLMLSPAPVETVSLS